MRKLGAQAGRRAAAGGSGLDVSELAGGRLLARRREATAGQRRERPRHGRQRMQPSSIYPCGINPMKAISALVQRQAV